MRIRLGKWEIALLLFASLYFLYIFGSIVGVLTGKSTFHEIYFINFFFWLFAITLVLRLFIIIKRKLLWKIRNRLIVAVLFFSVTPMILIATFAYVFFMCTTHEYNTIVFDNIIQDRLGRLERFITNQFNLKEPGKIIADLAYLRDPKQTSLRNQFVNMCFFQHAGREYLPFLQYPDSLNIKTININALLKSFHSGYFKLGNKLYLGILLQKEDLIGWAFYTITQEFLDQLPKFGDFHVKYDSEQERYTLSTIPNVTKKMEEAGGLDKFHFPFIYTVDYLNLDHMKGGLPRKEKTNFLFITDYSKLVKGFTSADPVKALEKKIAIYEDQLRSVQSSDDIQHIQSELSKLKNEYAEILKNPHAGNTGSLSLVLKAVLVLFIFFILTSLFIGYRVIRVITKSVNELSRGTERIRRGDFTYRIRIKSHDQMRELAESFNEMAAGIDRLLIEEKERQRLEEELRIARAIQLKLLPAENYSCAHFEIAAVNIPAEEIAGDYFDYFYKEDEFLSVLVADVAGKGSSAAFYMAEMKGIMNYLQQKMMPPVEVIHECHQSLLPTLDRITFITMIIAQFNFKTRHIRLARSGHTPAIYYQAQSGECVEYTPRGMAIGLVNLTREAFEEVDIPFERGDIMLLFSDGLSEMMNQEGQLLGNGNLKRLLHEYAALPADQIRTKILDFSIDFSTSKTNEDDLTFMIIKIK